MPLSDQKILKLKKKYPMLQYFTDRSFGVEIEFFGLDYVITPVDNNIIKPYCISSRAIDGRDIQQLCKDYKIDIGADRESWHFEKDTSVRGKCHTQHGVELTSPILKGIEGLEQVYNAFRLINDIKGADIDKSCGLHVHHGVDKKVFNCKQLQQLVRIVHPIEKYFYLLIPGNRNKADTCRPMEIDVKAFLDVCSADPEEGICKVRELWYSEENRYKEMNYGCSHYDKTRYHGLNLHSYWYRSTIEFRYHSAVMKKIDEAMQWIIFSQFIVEISQGNIPDINYYPEANKWMDIIYRIYLDSGYENCIKKLAN